jgi:hypothetical protein
MDYQRAADAAAAAGQPKSKKKMKKGTRRQRRESRLPPLTRCMTDPLKLYEIIPNGNPRFLTKASQMKILEVWS